MTAHLLIEEARAEGLELRANGDKLKYSGPVAVVEQWKPRLVASKAEIMAELSVPRSTWWLVHYLDGAPVEVWTSPPATQADILASHPEAIAAEPFEHTPRTSKVAHVAQAEPEPARASCATCAHVTGRGGCGEPVAAGLSDLEGVIRYHPNNGTECATWKELT